MMLKVLKRALLLFLAIAGLSAAGIGTLFWHHWRLSSICSLNDQLDAESSTCFYRVQPTGDLLSVLVFLAMVVASCLLISWLSFKLGRHAGKA